MTPNLFHRLLREYSRREWPAWGRWLSAFGVSGARNDRRWSSAPTLTIRGKLHHYLMELDLRNWSDRYTYFLERYYDLATQLLIMEVLQLGDRAVDIGANNGMLTLLMARLVGETGVVQAVEPNPHCALRIRRLIELNSLPQILLHECAVGDAVGEATLRQTSTHTGTGTLGALGADDQQRIHREFTVRVTTGDALFLADARPVVLLKMDVEGFECHALRGLTQTIRRDLPVIVTEVNARWLNRCRCTPSDLEALMRAMDYAPFAFTTPRPGGILERVRPRHLAMAPSPILAPDTNCDVLWLHERAPRRDYLRHLFLQT